MTSEPRLHVFPSHFAVSRLSQPYLLVKCYGKPSLIIQKREHTLGFGVFCMKMINQILQETLANHIHGGLICTSEIIKV